MPDPRQGIPVLTAAEVSADPAGYIGCVVVVLILGAIVWSLIS